MVVRAVGASVLMMMRYEIETPKHCARPDAPEGQPSDRSAGLLQQVTTRTLVAMTRSKKRVAPLAKGR